MTRYLCCSGKFCTSGYAVLNAADLLVSALWSVRNRTRPICIVSIKVTVTWQLRYKLLRCCYMGRVIRLIDWSVCPSAPLTSRYSYVTFVVQVRKMCKSGVRTWEALLTFILLVTVFLSPLPMDIAREDWTSGFLLTGLGQNHCINKIEAGALLLYLTSVKLLVWITCSDFYAVDVWVEAEGFTLLWEWYITPCWAE